MYGTVMLWYMVWYGRDLYLNSTKLQILIFFFSKGVSPDAIFDHVRSDDETVLHDYSMVEWVLGGEDIGTCVQGPPRAEVV